MSANAIFQLHLILGYVAWLLLFGTYVLPWLRSIDQLAAHRAIATLHSFRFLGLVFLVPGVVGPNLPPGFSSFAAYGDLLTGVLAMTALMTARLGPLFWLAVAAFNLVGLGDILLDYAHAIQNGLPAVAGQLGAAYWVPVLYVPILVITHVTALYWLARPSARLASVVS
ncbi:MAG TPA: hypothetical protein VGM26_01275 [Rhizomicrobium sp.]|jgi:hypothetical protein